VLTSFVGQVRQPFDHEVRVGAATHRDQSRSAITSVVGELAVQHAELVEVASDGIEACGLAIVAECALVAADADQRQPCRVGHCRRDGPCRFERSRAGASVRRTEFHHYVDGPLSRPRAE
jgi:hypothetical protein